MEEAIPSLVALYITSLPVLCLANRSLGDRQSNCRHVGEHERRIGQGGREGAREAL